MSNLNVAKYKIIYYIFKDYSDIKLISPLDTEDLC